MTLWNLPTLPDILTTQSWNTNACLQFRPKWVHVVYRMYTCKAIYTIVQRSMWHVASSIRTPYRLYTDATFSGRLDGGRTWQPSPAGHLPNSILHVQHGQCGFQCAESRAALDRECLVGVAFWCVAWWSVLLFLSLQYWCMVAGEMRFTAWAH